MTEQQSLVFLRYAPVVFSAIDKIQQDEREREQRRQRTREAAQARVGPKYPGAGM